MLWGAFLVFSKSTSPALENENKNYVMLEDRLTYKQCFLVLRNFLTHVTRGLLDFLFEIMPYVVVKYKSCLLLIRSAVKLTSDTSNYFLFSFVVCLLASRWSHLVIPGKIG